ncbi:YadA C-terminal domain-containing protein [Haemophilus haemolyticus]|uniref:YadA C-terminal domain-containing protein n=1 Tax=Haemophilus haemolyticus TaxID=726 RepID=UPI002159A739
MYKRQVLNGFKKGDDIFELDNNGNVKKRSATEDDVTKDDLEGKGVVATVIKNKDSIEDLSEDLAVTDDKVKELADHVKKNQEELNEAAGAVKDLQDGVSDLHEVVYGPEGKPEEGLVDIVTKHTDAIYGTDDNPGLMEVVRKQTEAINDLKAYNSLDDVKALVANKADKTDVDANKAEIAKKANASDVYTKIESDSKLDAKANASDVYTKTESDSKLNAKANVADVYSKTETDNKFALKADNSVVSAQAADISNLRTDVNAHTKRLDHLDNRVNKLDKDLKRGLAAQAALTGLFQPYTVGKANFTAAVGGYKSQTAVAIGTGYRYNQNIATKAGVAFTQGGGVTYNAGVNFEW